VAVTVSPALRYCVSELARVKVQSTLPSLRVRAPSWSSAVSGRGQGRVEGRGGGDAFAVGDGTGDEDRGGHRRTVRKVDVREVEVARRDQLGRVAGRGDVLGDRALEAGVDRLGLRDQRRIVRAGDDDVEAHCPS